MKSATPLNDKIRIGSDRAYRVLPSGQFIRITPKRLPGHAAVRRYLAKHQC